MEPVETLCNHCGRSLTGDKKFLPCSYCMIFTPRGVNKYKFREENIRRCIKMEKTISKLSVKGDKRAAREAKKASIVKAIKEGKSNEEIMKTIKISGTYLYKVRKTMPQVKGGAK